MTEVPEYLLERSRQRRAALGLPGGEAPAGGGGGAPAAAPASSSVATATAPEAPQPADAATATTVVTEPEPEVAVETGPRSGIPWWMMPVLLVLPFWAMIYMGAFAEPAAEGGPRTGAQIYVSAGCGSCHGPTGGGGVGPKLSGGETKLTFPNVEDMLKWVTEGSASSRGKPYGDPGRPGGQRPAASGGMPAFGTQLTPEEITTVVEYVREQL
ncbi:MAG TPA: c-type cytochrome [Acidimicrobiales bacterium]|nr:c-type cytochrome [Acidimicrobiales bacterium]